MSNIHPTAIIEPGARIGKNVTVGPYSVIYQNVCLEDDVIIKSHVCIDGYTIVGKGTVIWPQAVIGSKTQDLKYRGEKTFINIGKKCEIRECVTINSSCQEGSQVKIGDSCLLMAYCHIAHNCHLGNRVILSNNATLAGHVIVEDCAVIGGLSAIHQFSRIGAYAMVGGMSRVPKDVLPYTIGAGSPYYVAALNLVGLKRHGFSLDVRRQLSRAFRFIYRSGLSMQDALVRIQNELEPIEQIQHIIEFCQTSRRGLIGTEGIRSRKNMRRWTFAPQEECLET